MIQKIIVYTTQHWRCFRQNKQSIKSRIKPPTTILLIGSASPWINVYITQSCHIYSYLKKQKISQPALAATTRIRKYHWPPTMTFPTHWHRGSGHWHLWRSIPPRGHIIREGWTPWGRKPQETTDWSSDHPSCQKWRFDQLVVTVITKQLPCYKSPQLGSPNARISRAKPKSASFTVSPLTNKFSGFMSRWK